MNFRDKNTKNTNIPVKLCTICHNGELAAFKIKSSTYLVKGTFLNAKYEIYEIRNNLF